MRKSVLTIILSIIITFTSIVVMYFIFWFLSYGPQEIKLNKLKSGWHVEILNSYINIREEAAPESTKIGQVKKGSIYEVLEMNMDNKLFIFYKIKISDKKTGWIANPKKGNAYLKDNNNPNDIAAPTIKFFQDIYFVKSIEEINYNHLEITDDKENYKVTHKVYHEVVPEEDKDQYWIVYIVTDASGKNDSITQRIIFEEIPAESKVIDFKYYER